MVRVTRPSYFSDSVVEDDTADATAVSSPDSAGGAVAAGRGTEFEFSDEWDDDEVADFDDDDDDDDDDDLEEDFDDDDDDDFDDDVDDE